MHTYATFTWHEITIALNYFYEDQNMQLYRVYNEQFTWPLVTILLMTF